MATLKVAEGAVIIVIILYSVPNTPESPQQKAQLLCETYYRYCTLGKTKVISTALFRFCDIRILQLIAFCDSFANS